MAEDTSTRPPIVVKKIKKVAGGAHGGAWKIAYADFVTAMMAFFLLMWLLGSSTSGTLEGIAEYFKTPLKVALSGGSSVGESSSIKDGGGTDLTRREGQVKDGSVRESMIKDKKSADKELVQLEQLKERIEAAIEANPALRKFKDQLLLDMTSEGLRIQIVDAQNRPMFSSGRADLQPYAQMILQEIGQTLNGVTNKISLSGHTDAAPFPSGNDGYSNWELSADRANASRRALIAGDMDPQKILRVVGLSSAVLFDPLDPYNPINRRITITVMNNEAVYDVIKDAGRQQYLFR